MKKTLTRILGASVSIVASLLIIILVITAFGGIKVEDIQKGLGKGLIIALSVIFLALMVVFFALLFSSDDVIKEIIIKSEHKGSVYATMSVIRKSVKNATAEMEGIKTGKVNVISTEFGVRLVVNVKVVDQDADIAATRVRLALEDEFNGSLGYTFNSIEVRIKSLQSQYSVDNEEISKKAEKEVKEARKAKIEEQKNSVKTENIAREINKKEQEQKNPVNVENSNRKEEPKLEVENDVEVAEEKSEATEK